jgi:xanthosine utilization system XapX-like protein
VADKFGEWSLFISDRAGGDFGSIGQWQINMVNLPAPGSLALLGVGGLVIGRRRR